MGRVRQRVVSVKMPTLTYSMAITTWVRDGKGGEGGKVKDTLPNSLKFFEAM